jgi:hypothetical protein
VPVSRLLRGLCRHTILALSLTSGRAFPHSGTSGPVQPQQVTNSMNVSGRLGPPNNCAQTSDRREPNHCIALSYESEPKTGGN